MGKTITLIIDNQNVSVPEGTLIVDAAKKIGIDIPVFCYHPKMEPVGMCRMCLVEIGRPVMDRATRQPVLNEDGTPKIGFGPKLETSCTTPVAEGMVVRTTTEVVSKARKEVVEFILTSHPLDCPICDKGGECPLQNLTMQHGVGTSRFIFEDKKHLAKHVSLGELIYLDRERCIQCGRCVRFQHEIVDDPVIGFFDRGRSLEIITQSEPGFDSVFSGNTTDICPVGALTTADFRFGARPWEMKSSASICTHCPVGCNIEFNIRREAKADGKIVIKRVLPRQNEAVNEIWVCDKGRLGYHFAESKQRLTKPMIRKDGKLVETSWDDALMQVEEHMRKAGESLVTLVGGRLANEDLYNLGQLTRAQKGKAVLYSNMAGGELVMQVGVGKATNLKELGAGSTIIVVASDLHEEAPIWWLRVKQAVERGAKLIVLNARPTRLDQYASQVIYYQPGEAVKTISGFSAAQSANMTAEMQAAAKSFVDAENGIIFYGSDGIGLQESGALAQACAALLLETKHYGKANNGLIPVWTAANTQGAFEMGFLPDGDLVETLKHAEVVLIAAADPVGDDPNQAFSMGLRKFVVVMDLFMTETAEMADVVLPVQAFTEREGSYTSGERRVQRFYSAVPPLEGPLSDYKIAARLGKRLGMSLEGDSVALIMKRIAEQVPAFAGITYQKLAEVKEQWPVINRSDLYYGGTSYDNKSGLGVQLQTTTEEGKEVNLGEIIKLPDLVRSEDALFVFPVTRLYDQGTTLQPTTLLEKRMTSAVIRMNPATAARFAVSANDSLLLLGAGWERKVQVEVDSVVPEGLSLVPRSTGIPVAASQIVQVQRLASVPETRGDVHP